MVSCNLVIFKRVFSFRYLRVDAVYAACGVRNEVCLSKTKELFDKWIKNDSL